MNLRYVAAKVINSVSNGHSLADCLEPEIEKLADQRDRAFVQAVCYGVCRFYETLDVMLSYLLKKPMNAKDSDIHSLLLVGLYQLMEMRVAPHAAVSETVNAVNDFNKTWARGFVNAILREFLRSQSQLTDKIKDDEEAFYSHPIWWIKNLKKAWPAQWQAILLANNEHPPMSLRVNLKKISREAYLKKLCEAEMEAEVIPYTMTGVWLKKPVGVEEIPGFAAGIVSVQDGASQLTPELLNVATGLRILDACAAPGGKLMHILEAEPNVEEVVAVEKDRHRADMLKVLTGKFTCIIADAADTTTWWDGKLFDRILLDAPCSASGIVRRHPDIKLLRQPTDIPKLAKEQMRLLSSLWPLLKPGGQLLYATCSIFPQENTEVIQSFLTATIDAKELKIEVPWGIVSPVGRQILPGMHQMDGFFFARLTKLA